MTWSLALGSPSRSLAKQTLIKDLLVSTPPMADPWPRLHISVPHTDTQSSVLGSTVVITLHFTIISCSPVVILLTDQCHVSTITHYYSLLLTCPPTSSPCPCPAARPLQWLINLRNSGGCSHLISRSTSLASCLIYQTYLMMSYMGGR